METLTLCRSDFRPNEDDGSSMFETVLYDLRIPKEQWDDIEDIGITVNGFVVYKF